MTPLDTERVVSLAGRALLGNPPTLAFTRDMCRALIDDHVPGTFVECGVGAGCHPAVMAAVLAERGDTVRSVHLFDSFEGIPIAGPEDAEQPGDPASMRRDGALESSGVSASSAPSVRANLVSWGVSLERCVFHAGWFQDTVARAAETLGPIALLRLDGDLYESTRVCLDALYPLVVPGGVVVIDDYALVGCRKAVDRCLASREEHPQIQAIQGGGGPVWWRAYPRHPRCASFDDPSARCTCAGLSRVGNVFENCPARHPDNASQLRWGPGAP